MSRRDARRGRIGLLFLLLPLLQLFAARASGRQGDRLIPALSGRSDVEWALAKARRLAEEKLSTVSCALIFSDFKDRGGRPVSDRLLALGQDGSGYMRQRVLFYDGHGLPPCATRDTIAYTSPGSAVVFICSRQFVERAHRDPGLAAALLIHEELHSLGLFENPPSSKEITARVIARCGK